MKPKQTAMHTPGPWEHGDNGLIYGQCAEDDVDAPFVCDVIDDSAMQALGMLSPVEEANARLIAAAPELLDALTHTLDFLHANDDGEDDVRWRIEKAQAAIAKATGRAA